MFEYMRYNRDVLERYMMEEVDQDALERWTIARPSLSRDDQEKLSSSNVFF